MTLTQLNCKAGFAKSPGDMSLMSLCVCVCVVLQHCLLEITFNATNLFKFMKHVISAWIMVSDIVFFSVERRFFRLHCVCTQHRTPRETGINICESCVLLV